MALVCQSVCGASEQHLATISELDLGPAFGPGPAQQGLDYYDGAFYTVSGWDPTCLSIPTNNRLSSYTSSGVLIDERGPFLLLPPHFGDLSANREYLYVPMSYFDLCPGDGSPFFLGLFNRSDLTHQESYSLSELDDIFDFEDVAGVDYFDGDLYLVDYRDDTLHNTRIIRIDLDTLAAVSAFELSSRKVNGIERHGPHFFLTSDRDDRSGEIHVYEIAALSQTSVNSPLDPVYTYDVSGGEHKDFEHAEGLSFKGDQLWVSVANGTRIRRLVPPSLPSPYPYVRTLVVTPGVAVPGTTLTLDALGVGDATGTVHRVDFYRDVNGNCALETATDDHIATDFTGADGWSRTTPLLSSWGDGMIRFLAQATDNDGNTSEVKCAAVIVGDQAPAECVTDWYSCNSLAVLDGLMTFCQVTSGPNVPDDWSLEGVEYDLKVNHSNPGDLFITLNTGLPVPALTLWDVDDGCESDCGDDDDPQDDDDVELGGITHIFDGYSPNAYWTLTVWDLESNGQTGVVQFGRVRFHYGAQGTPDLAVESISTDPSPPRANEPCDLVVQFENNGSTSAFDIEVSYIVDGREVEEDSHSILEPGDDQTEQDSFTFTQGGTHTLQVVVQQNGCPSERRIGNNSLTATIDVLPVAPSQPVPQDNQSSVTLSGAIQWQRVAGAHSYHVYLGTDATPDRSEFQATATATVFPYNDLEEYTDYYWRIDSVNAAGVTPGPVWHFRTRSCAMDATDDNAVNERDVALIIERWDSDDNDADLDESGVVDVDDLIAAILNWGPCPTRPR